MVMTRDRLINTLGITGMGLIAAGCWLLSPAAGLIAAGAMLFGLSLAAVLRRPEKT